MASPSAAPSPNNNGINSQSYDFAQVNTEHREQNQARSTSPIKIENTPAENRTHSAGLNAMGFQFAERQNYKNSVFRKATDQPLSVRTHQQMEREYRMFAFEEET